jgi:RecA/RadA recombinase
MPQSIETKEPKVIKIKPEEVVAEKPTEEKTPLDYGEDIEGGEQSTIKKLEDIQGIGPALAAKLREKGYSVLSLATARPDIVSGEMQITYSIAKSICNQAKDAALAKMEIHTATEFDKKLKEMQFHIKTGSSELDTILGGGIPTMSITGSSARFSTGKTQIGFSAIVDVLANLWVCLKCRRIMSKGETCPKDGIMAVRAKVAFIETEEDTFHLDRLKEIADARGLKGINWDNLFVFPAWQIPTAKAQFLQYKLVQKLCEGWDDLKRDEMGKPVLDSKTNKPIVTCHHEPEPIIFVVVDSMNANFRAGWSESNMLPIRTREFAEHFALMKYLAGAYNTGWYLTHQVIAPIRPDQGTKMKVKFLSEYYPVGGDLVLHTINNWIALDDVCKGVLEVELFDSSYLRKGTCYVQLTEKGIENAGYLMKKREEEKASKSSGDGKPLKVNLEKPQ